MACDRIHAGAAQLRELYGASVGRDLISRVSHALIALEAFEDKWSQQLPVIGKA
jgi:hypothetical protein